MSVTVHANPSLKTKSSRPFRLIGELINNSFGRAAKAFRDRDVAGFQKLAKLQSDMGADYLTINIDGTQSMRVMPAEMFDFLPDLIPAIQEVTSVPLAFDNPSIEFHKRCLKIYDRKKSGQPILNSVAASRHNLREMVDLVAEHDTMVIGMASEKFVEGGGAQCMSADDVYGATEALVHLLRDKAGRRNDQIIIDPGLAPVGADTYGLVNMGIDAMRRIRANPDLAGLHLSVGLTNFSFGVPKDIRELIESAYLTIAVEAGLDFVLGNPEKDLHLLAKDDKYVLGIAEALEAGRPGDGETQEEAGFRQAAKIIDLFNEVA
ncbi:MAG TPA: dihydropteroate synthase [Tepidisphaeraceae bacterium]|jgi:cobalamin-dependent methionine synthase I|nr:dihydropteroate synthase [Tepidisphaeraceae bacterium]